VNALLPHFLTCRRPPVLATLLAATTGCLALLHAGATVTNPPPWLDRPLTLEDCLNLALQQNGEVRKSLQDVAAALGVVIQTRAIVLPKLRAGGGYAVTEESAAERIAVPPLPGIPPGLDLVNPDTQRWSASVRLVQSVFEGGRLSSSLRTARLTREQALARHEIVLADVTTDVRVAFYDVLVTEQEIAVREASVKLLEQELEDTQRRFNAGTVPRFNVLRAEVELANARPSVSRAKNAYRIAKNGLVNRLGYEVPRDVWEDLPLKLAGTLDVDKFEIAVPKAIALALEQRPELLALRKAEALGRENVVSARAGRLPSVQSYVGYGSHSPSYERDLSRDISGWEAGVQVSWDLFDGGLTRGKARQAHALWEKTQVETDDTTRNIELEVRTAYSTLEEAGEVLTSQEKVCEQAEEALRLANARAEAGTGTQLDVLGAQTALTEARTTQVRAKHDYAVARTRLERAIGAYTPELANRDEMSHLPR